MKLINRFRGICKSYQHILRLPHFKRLKEIKKMSSHLMEESRNTGEPHTQDSNKNICGASL